MSSNIIEWIARNKDSVKDLMHKHDYENLYTNLRADGYELESGSLTMTLLNAGINPLKYMHDVPVDFAALSSLLSISIPDQIKVINAFAFFSCATLSNVRLNNVKKIGFKSFAYSGIRSIDLSNIIASDVGSFLGCSNLDKVEGIKMKIIPTGMLEQCSNLKTVLFISGTTNIAAKAFAESGIETIDLPDTLQFIGSKVFLKCDSLQKIYIPPSVNRIKDNAFDGISDVDIYCKPSNAELIGNAIESSACKNVNIVVQ